jgi:hypothetical protein
MNTEEELPQAAALNSGRPNQEGTLEQCGTATQYEQPSVHGQPATGELDGRSPELDASQALACRCGLELAAATFYEDLDTTGQRGARSGMISGE